MRGAFFRKAFTENEFVWINPQAVVSIEAISPVPKLPAGGSEIETLNGTTWAVDCSPECVVNILYGAGNIDRVVGNSYYAAERTN